MLHAAMPRLQHEALAEPLHASNTLLGRRHVDVSHLTT
mgnify:CR=1 FL=1